MLVELSRARRKIWIDPDDVMWTEAAGSGATVHFLDGWNLTVDQSPNDVEILCRKG